MKNENLGVCQIAKVSTSLHGLTVGLVVYSVNAYSTNVTWAVIRFVETGEQVQYEMQGQNMCIDEMIVFLVFLFCVVVKCSSFWRNVLPPSSG